MTGREHEGNRKGQTALLTLARHWLLAFLSPRPFVGFLYFPRFVKHYRKFKRLSRGTLAFRDTYPCMGDWMKYTPFDPHYFYQAAWLARMFAAFKPERNIDIGSSVMTIGVLSAVVNTIFVDYRPLLTNLSNLCSISADIVFMPFRTNSIESLSCLHVIEHIGLGRYGEQVDPEGSFKAARELERILKPGGKLYLSVPVGRERVCFNAHRVFRPQTVSELFPALCPIEFCFVDDRGAFVEDQPLSAAAECEYGCGLFIFEKPST